MYAKFESQCKFNTTHRKSLLYQCFRVNILLKHYKNLLSSQPEKKTKKEQSSIVSEDDARNERKDFHQWQMYKRQLLQEFLQ